MLDDKYSREIINRGEGFYEVQCYQCNKWFESQRYDAAFCSSTCRSRNHREAKQVDKDIIKAKALVNALISRLPRKGDSKIYKELTSLRNRIDSALSTVEGE